MKKAAIEYLLWYLLFSFLVFATWEWVQTPFFVDVTRDINTIVWYRIHCTFGDILILSSSMLAVGILTKRAAWFLQPDTRQLVLVTLIGVGYTLFSEYRNVHLAGNWGYSEYMPTLFGIGLVPVIQWLVLPVFILYITRRFVSTCARGAA